MPNNNWKVTVGAELEKNAGKQIQDGLNKVTPKPIEVPFKIDFKNSKEIENEMKRIVSKLTNGKGSLADFKINTSTIFDEDSGKRIEKINSALIKYKNELGEVISELYKFNQIGSNIDSSGQKEAIMGWSKVMSTYGQNIEQVTKKEEALAKKQQASIMKQKELVEQMKLLQIQADKSGTTLDQEYIKGFETASTNQNIAEMTHYLKLAKTEYSQLNAMMEKDLPISGLENMKKNIGTMPIDIQNVETSFKKLQVQPEELRTRIDQLGNSFKSLENFKGAEADKVKQYNLLKNEITGVTKEVKSLIAAQQQQISLDDKTKFSSSITSWSNDNIKGAKLFRVELERIRRELVDADKTKFTSLKKEFGSIQKQTEAMGKSGRTAFQEIGNNFKKFASWYGIAGITTSAVRGIKQMVSTVIELDQSLVDLQQATGFTAEETGKLLNTYIDLGQELGATGTEVAQAADVWLRQGKSLAETNTLIRDSMILSKIGQVDSAKATQYLTSAMKGYKLEASEVLSVIDKMASVDLSSATSIGGLAEAMSRTANGARIAGVEMDKLLGMLAVVGEVSQKSMDSVGESFKTIFARMGNVKLGKLVDEDGNDITTEINDVEKILNKVDIKLRVSATEFRNFGNVLDDVGKDWSKFNAVEQNAIASAFAGVRQRESFVTLMENYGDSLKYAEISANSAGTAMDKFSAYEESVEAKTKRLQTSLQELAVGTLDSSVVKRFLDLANGAVNATTAIGGLVPVVTALGVAYGVHKILLPILIKQMSALLLAETGVTATTLAQIKAQAGLNGTIALGTTAIWSNIAALKAWITTTPAGWILLITGAVVGLISHLNSLEESFETIKQEWDDLQTEINNVNNELKTTSSRIDELLKKDSLTIIEQDELERLQATNAELDRHKALLQKQQEFLKADFAEGIYKKYLDEFSYDKVLGQAISKDIGINIFESTTKNIDLARYSELEEKKLNGIKLTKKEKEEYDNLGEKLSAIAIRFKELSDEYPFDDDVKQNWLDMYNIINRVMNPALYKQEDFDNIFNSDDFKKAKEELLDYAKAGELTAETISSNKEYQKLLGETGLSADEVVEHIKAITTSTDKATNSTSTFSTSIFDTLNKSLDDLDKKSKDAVSSVKELNQVLYDQSQGTKLTSEQAYKLITQYPQLASALEKTTDGYTINEEAIENVRLALINQEKANANAQLNMTKDTLNAVSDRVEAYGIELESITTLQSALNEQSKLPFEKIYGSMEGFSFDDATKRITTPRGPFIADSTSTVYDSIKGAYQEQKLIHDTIGKMGNLQERINGLQNDLISDEGFGVNEGKGGSGKKDTKDYIKEAFDLGIKDKKGNIVTEGKNDLDHKLAMEEITQKQYLDGLEKINKATYGKNKKTHLEQYRQYVAEVYKGRKKIDEDNIKSKFDDLSHSFAMGDIKTEEDYQKQRWELAKDYYKNNKDYLGDWKKAQEEWYKWNLDQTEKSTALEQKKRLNTIDKIIDKYGELRDTINKTAENQTGDAQVSTYSEGIKYANKEIKYIEKEIKKLNKRKITNLFTQDDYDSQLANLQSALSKARSSIDNFNKSISESIKKSSEETMDIIEKSFNKTTEYWENQKKDYSDIIKAQKDILQLKKEQNEYEKSIAKKTKEISKIESRMADLSKAAMTGDRQANAELKKLEEDLADKKEDLSDTQSDHEYDLANDALDKALDDNDKIIDAKLKAIKTEYEERKTIQEDLFKQLETLTTNAKNFTIAEYSAAIDEIAAKFAQSGIMLDDTTIGGLKGSQGQPYNNANPVYSILGNKSNSNMSQDTSSLSGLNKFLASQGYSIANKDKMVQLAQALGLYNITSPDMVGTDKLGRANKNLIMEELKRLFSGSTFSKGGIAKLPKMMGEDGFALIKNGEPILTVEQGKLFKELVNNIKPLNNLVKLSTPNLSGITNNNNSPNISIPITIQGNATPSTVSALNNAGNNIVKQIMNEVRKL